MDAVGRKCREQIFQGGGEGLQSQTVTHTIQRLTPFPHPNLLLTDFPVRPPAGELRSTKFAPGEFVPEGEGICY